MRNTMSQWKWIVAAETVALAVLLVLFLRGDPLRGATPDAPSRGPNAPADAVSMAVVPAAAAEPAPERAVVAPPRAEPDYVLFGRVLDAHGQPLTGANIYLGRTAQGGGRSATTDGGRYAIAGLAAGEWQLHATAEGYHRHREAVVFTAEQPTLRRDVVLTRAIVLMVRARTPEGEPLEDAARKVEATGGLHMGVEAYAAAFVGTPPASLPLTDTRSTHGLGVGDFRSRWHYKKEAGEPPDCIGHLTLTRDLPVHVALMLRQSTLASQVVSPGASEVVFELSFEAMLDLLGSIRVRIVDGETGAPIEGARVAITDRQGGGSASGRSPETSVITHEGIPPGRWNVLVSAKDYEPVSQVVRLEPRQHLDLGDVVLHKVGKLSGVVLGVDGRPVQASLRWDALERRHFPQPLRNWSAESDTEGEFTFQVGRGRYVVHALVGTAAAAHVLVEIGAEPPPRLEIRLLPTLPVRVQNEIADRDFYQVEVRTRDGVPVFAQELRSSGIDTIWLPRGDYLVDIHRDVTPVRSYELRVGSGEAVLRVP